MEREKKSTEELEDQEQFLKEIFGKALTIHKSSAKLWRKYLEMSIKLDKDKLVDDVFGKAIKATPDESLQFWIDYYHYYLSKAGDKFDKPSEILKRAIEKGTPQVSNHFKPLLIEFVATYFNDPYETRAIYKELTKNSKPCLEIHFKMAEYEKFFMEDSVVHDDDGKCKDMRNCFENAVTFFGKTEPDVSFAYPYPE